MKDFFSKLSLYDFLTTILLGGYCFKIVCYWDISFPVIYSSCEICSNLVNGADGCILLFTFYVLGLIIHKLVECFDYNWYLGRICPKAPAFDNIILRTIGSIFLPIVSRHPKVILSISRRSLLEMISEKDRNLLRDKNENDEKYIVYDYYKAYDYLSRNNKLGNVPRIEAHSALIKDLFYASILLFWTPLKFWAFLVLLVMMIIRCRCEFKIIELVWEGYYYDIINKATY